MDNLINVLNVNNMYEFSVKEFNFYLCSVNREARLGSISNFNLQFKRNFFQYMMHKDEEETLNYLMPLLEDLRFE